MTFFLTKLLELVILQPGHDPIERVNLLPLPRRHQPGVLRPYVKHEYGLAVLLADPPEAPVGARRIGAAAASAGAATAA